MRTVGLQEGLQVVERLANSRELRDLSSKYGKKPDGEYRIQVVDNTLIHYSKVAKKIKRKGFDPSKRNPYLLGSSLIHDWNERRPEIEEILGPDSVTVLLAGPLWHPCREGDVPPDVLCGQSGDPMWNAMVKEVAAEVGLKLPWPRSRMTEAYWEARARFADGVRQRLLSEGIAGVQVGGEVEVIDLEAILIISDD